MNLYPKITALLLCITFTFTAPAQKAVKKFIKKYELLAAKKSQAYGIPASVILGISIVESAAGKSAICKHLNNFFGIKGKNKNSRKAMGFKSAYKEYKTPEESFENFCQVVKGKKYYSKLKGSADFKKWLQQMNTSSYASAKQKWVNDVTATINKFELVKLDTTLQRLAAVK